MSVEITDNSSKVLSQLESNIGTALTMIGSKWQEIVTMEITNFPAVDTGRMRSSMTFRPNIAAKEVVVGTNVEYAIFVTMGTWKMKKRPFMQNSILNYKADYQEIVASVLGRGFST